MVDEIHVLPIGFDVNRLIAPLNDEAFAPDRVILVGAESDPIPDTDTHNLRTPTKQTDVSPSDRLLVNAWTQLRRQLENYPGLDVEVTTVRSFDNYAIAYEDAYGLFWELSEEHVVHCNLSSLPLSAAAAFLNAEAAVAAESAHCESEVPRRDRLHSYYIRPETYVEAEAISALEEISEYLDSIREITEPFYPEQERKLYETIAIPLRRKSATLRAYLDDIENRIESADGDYDEDCAELIADGRAALDDLGDWLATEREEESEVPPAFNAHRQSPMHEIDEVEKAFTELGDAVLDDEQRADVSDLISRLRGDLERFWGLQEWVDDVRELDEYLWEVSGFAEAVLDDVESYGMTRGVAEHDGERHVTVSAPPLYELREMEFAILYVLHRDDEQEFEQSIRGIAAEIALVLREHLVAYDLTRDDPAPTGPDFMGQALELVQEHGRRTMLDTLEDRMETSFRSRIQYNLTELRDKQYINRRQDQDDRRRSVHELSQTGELWVRTHDLVTKSRGVFDTLLAKEIEKYHSEVVAE